MNQMDQIDFYQTELLLTDEEKKIRAMVRQFVDQECMPIIADFFDRGTFPMDLIPRMAQLGLGSEEMGRRLGINTRLVRSRWSRIHKRLGTSTRTAAVRRAVEAGLIDPIKPLV